MHPPFAPSDALRPQFAEGRQVADAGDLARAEALFRDLITTGAGEGPFDRLFLLSSLMTIWSRLGKEFETLVVARHLKDLLLGIGQLEAAAGCMATFCETLSGVGGRALRREHLDDLARMLETLEAHEGAMPREAYHGCAFELALEEGDIEGARHHAERYRAHVPTLEGRPWRKESYSALLDIRLDLASGMPQQALHALERLETRVRGVKEPAAMLAWMRIGCLEAAGLTSRAQSAARGYLALLERMQRDSALAPRRLRNASLLAGWFAKQPGYEAAARRTYDLAAAAVIQRMAQLDAAVRELAAIGVDAGTSDDDLAELRRSFLAEQGELLARVAELFRRDPSAYAHLLVAEDDDEGVVHLCAWCECVRGEEGAWLPIGHLLPRAGPLPISHGICSACLAREHSE